MTDTKKLQIKKIFKEHECCPIRWFAELEDGSFITIRERFCDCIVYKEAKSIFDVKEEDVLLEFKTEQSSDDSTLTIALEKLGAIVDPNAFNYIDESYDNYIDLKENGL